MDNAIVNKIRKLLELSRNNTSPEEAAIAAARAQEMMFKYSIGEADLDLGEETGPEDIVETVMGEDGKKKMETWRSMLGRSVAESLGCKLFTRRFRGAMKGIRLQIVGPTSAVQTANYLFMYLCHEMDRLADEAHKNSGTLVEARRYKNSFRLGAVEIVAKRLDAQRAAQNEYVRGKLAAGEQTPGLVLFKTNEERVADFMKNYKIKSGPKVNLNIDPAAYVSGREAGAGISLSNTGKALGGRKQEIA